MNQVVDQSLLWTAIRYVFAGVILLYFAIVLYVIPLIDSTFKESLIKSILSSVGIAGTVVVALYSLLRWKLWRWQLLYPWFVRVPDLTGTWVGETESGFFGTPVDGRFTGDRTPAITSIDHRFDYLDVTMYHPNSFNHTLTCVLTRGSDNRMRLFLTYQNRPYSSQDPKSADHEGCAILDLFDMDKRGHWRIDGNYWTNKTRSPMNPRDRGTWGKVRLTFEKNVTLTQKEASCRPELQINDNGSRA